MEIRHFFEKKKHNVQTRVKIDHDGTQGIALVALDGWDSGPYEKPHATYPNAWTTLPGTRGMQVRLSLNGPLKMTIEEWRNLVTEIEYAYEGLQHDA